MATMLASRMASAHISLEEGGTHKSRYGDGEIKGGPCGRLNGARGPNVYTYAPGQKITVSVIESIPHPGYFRIAFDNDGDDAFVTPRSIKPLDPNRKCPNDPTDQCGMSDFYNSPAVLPGMDNLNPHLTARFGTKYTWEVTLPDVECTHCTLQVLQVMEDDLTHGPYDTRPGVGVEDVYFQCIDLVLKRSNDAGTGDGTDAGTTDAGTPPGDSGGTGTGGAGGAGGSGGGTAGAGGTPRDAGNTGTGGATGGTGATTGGGATGGAGGATGGAGGATGGAGGATGGAGGSGNAGAGGASAGSAGATAGSSGSGPGDGDDGGCAVATGGRPGGAGVAALLSLVGIALASRRRRR
jgi:MYXO-CTERM domain-containing protein